MGRADFLRLGDWNALCYTCGFKSKASALKRNWQGFYECPSCWTPRQPQDFVRGIPEHMTPPWTQPVPTPIYITTDFLCTEDSDTTNLSPMFYICTETLYPLETEN